MKSTLRTIRTYACALALAATFAACTKTVIPGTTPSSSAAQKTSFSGGNPITVADLTALPATLPAEPPPYDGSISREQYANFAWRQFIYLNSPAQTYDLDRLTVIRGEIATDGIFRNFTASGDPFFFKNGQPGDSYLGFNQLVWETFAHRSELFPADAPPQGSLRLKYPEYVFANINVFHPLVRFNNLDETTQIGQNQIFFPKNGKTPSANPYDDYMVLFEAKVNGAEYSYINSVLGKAYNPSVLPTSIEFPPNKSTSDESIEVKAAWREMSDELIKSGRYHTAEATYYVSGTNNGSPGASSVEAKVGTFGLVGLHILRKTKNYPTFIYTTFEHVDNLSSGLYFITLYNTMNYDYKTSQTVPPAIVNNGSGQLQSFALPLQGPVNAANGYPIIHGSFNLPSTYAGPISAGVSHATTDAVTKVNQQVLDAMNSSDAFNFSVWKYYRLAGIQVVPTNEDSPGGKIDQKTEDFYLANTVIESSQPGIQLFKGAVSDPGTRGAADNQLINERMKANILQVKGLDPSTNQVVMGGCMGCHGNAQYPRTMDGNGPGPSIFNFLTTPDTLSGTGFKPDVRPSSFDEVKARTQVYIK